MVPKPNRGRAANPRTEIRIRRFDGVFRWFQAHGRPIRDAEGRVLHGYALHTDIDDRKEAEEALRASEFNARMIVDSIPGLVARVSPAGEVEVVNRPILDYRWFQSRGLPLRDPEGRTLHWYVLLTDIEERKQVEDKLRRSEAFLAEGQHLAKIGSFSWRVARGEITCLRLLTSSRCQATRDSAREDRTFRGSLTFSG